MYNLYLNVYTVRCYDLLPYLNINFNYFLHLDFLQRNVFEIILYMLEFSGFCASYEVTERALYEGKKRPHIFRMRPEHPLSKNSCIQDPCAFLG